MAPPRISAASGGRGAAAAAALLALLVAQLPAAATPLAVTLRNDVPRLDVDGKIIDCHSGMILAVNGVFYMYGEHYGNSTGDGPSPPLLFPKIVVYTSPDLQAWTFRGFVLSDWPTKPYGTFFTPWAVYDKASQTFVLWFNAYLNGCCAGNWGVATSKDGISFVALSLNTGGAYGLVDCNALFTDDDGQSYLLYTSEAQDHHHSIELLTPNKTAIAGKNFGLFPDRYTEGGMYPRQNPATAPNPPANSP